jgi:hypothetical protein
MSDKPTAQIGQHLLASLPLHRILEGGQCPVGERGIRARKVH